MTIEKAGGTNLDAVQTQLVTVSKEQRLVQLYEMEEGIIALREESDQLRHQQNAIKNEIKSREKDKRDLMDLLGKGQETFVQVPMADESDQDEDSDKPTDAELAEFDDPAEEAGPAGPTSDPSPKNEADFCPEPIEDSELIDLNNQLADAIQGGNRDAADSLVIRIDKRKAALKAENETNNPEWQDSEADSGSATENPDENMQPLKPLKRKKGGKK